MNVISEQITFTIQRFHSPVSSPGVINVHIHHDMVGGCSASSGAELRWSCAPRPLINYCIWIVVHSSLIIMLLCLILSLICFAWSWKTAPPPLLWPGLGGGGGSYTYRWDDESHNSNFLCSFKMSLLEKAARYLHVDFIRCWLKMSSWYSICTPVVSLRSNDAML
jgi:hypothetical protein